MNCRVEIKIFAKNIFKNIAQGICMIKLILKIEVLFIWSLKNILMFEFDTDILDKKYL